MHVGRPSSGEVFPAPMFLPSPTAKDRAIAAQHAPLRTTGVVLNKYARLFRVLRHERRELIAKTRDG